MITRRHIRRAAAWIGVGAGAVGLLGYILSLFWSVYDDRSTSIVYFGRGAFIVQWGMRPLPPNSTVGMSGTSPGWHVEGVGTRPWRWLPRCDDPDRLGNAGTFVLPYWVLMAVGVAGGYVLLPAGYGPGRCGRCGYPLRGIAPANGAVCCPECGMPNTPGASAG